jgi:hypothetical protein
MLLLLNYYRRGPPFLFVVLYLSYFLLYPFLSCLVLFQKFIKWFFFSHRILQSYQISKKKKKSLFLIAFEFVEFILSNMFNQISSPSSHRTNSPNMNMRSNFDAERYEWKNNSYIPFYYEISDFLVTYI